MVKDAATRYPYGISIMMLVARVANR